MAGEVTVRLATLQDKDAVMKIDQNMYEGRDYLPEYYQHFIESPYIRPYVCVKDAAIVGFVAAHLVDDYQTMVLRAARVAESYMNTGIGKTLKKDVFMDVMAAHPVTKASSVGLLGPVTRPTSSLIPSETLQFSHDSFSYTLPASQLRATCTEDTVGAPKVVTEEHLRHCLKTDVVRRYLFPQNRIIADWIPYRLLPSNARMIMGFDGNTFILSDLEETPSYCRGMLSLCSWYKCKDSVYFANINWYGEGESSLRTHLAVQIRRLRQLCRGSTVNILATPSGHIGEETVHQTLRSFGLIPKPFKNSIRLKRYLYEMDLPVFKSVL